MARLITDPQPIEVEITARAFSPGPVEPVHCRVTPDGDVLVFDRVAGHYTTCHSMDEADRAEALRVATERAAAIRAIGWPGGPTEGAGWYE